MSELVGGDSYGSKLAPASGTWYGSVFQGYFAESGKGSIASVYVELAKESVVPQEYILAKFNDGKHAVEVNLNYTNEGATARAKVTEIAQYAGVSDTQRIMGVVSVADGGEPRRGVRIRGRNGHRADVLRDGVRRRERFRLGVAEQIADVGRRREDGRVVREARD